MGICEIGEKKRIDGKWYTKEEAARCGYCDGCSISTDAIMCHLYAKESDTRAAIEDRGAECCGTVWVACDAPAKPKPAPKAKWDPVDLFSPLPKRCSQEGWALALASAQEFINKLGAENAKLKNQITKLKGAKA